MKPELNSLNSPVARFGVLVALVALATGCPSNSPTTPVKPAVKKATTAATSAPTAKATGTGGDTADGSTSTSTPGTTPNGVATTSTGATLAPGATSAAAVGGATPTPVPTATTVGGATTAATPTIHPSVGPTDGGAVGGTTPVPVLTPTPAPVPTPTPTPTPAPPAGGTVTSFAGNGQRGFINAGGLDAEFFNPRALALQGTSALFVGDAGDNRIRRIDLSAAPNNVSFVAGGGTAGYHNGIGPAALFDSIEGMALDAQNNLYISDHNNNVVRKVDITDALNPVVTTLAGVPGGGSHVDGPGTSAHFFGPEGMVVVGSNLYVAEQSGRDVRMINLLDGNSTVTSIAGNGDFGTANGTGKNATFKLPVGLAADAQGQYLYVMDAAANNIRRISLTDGNYTVSTIAGVGGPDGNLDGPGSGAAFATPMYGTIAADGALYVTDQGNQAIRRIDLNDPNYTTTTYAGSSNKTAGFQDGQSTNALFNFPNGVVALGNTLYVADVQNFRIRQVQ